MSWAEILKINSDLSTPLDILIRNSSKTSFLTNRVFTSDAQITLPSGVKTVYVTAIASGGDGSPGSTPVTAPSTSDGLGYNYRRSTLGKGGDGGACGDWCWNTPLQVNDGILKIVAGNSDTMVNDLRLTKGGGTYQWWNSIGDAELGFDSNYRYYLDAPYGKAGIGGVAGIVTRKYPSVATIPEEWVYSLSHTAPNNSLCSFPPLNLGFFVLPSPSNGYHVATKGAGKAGGAGGGNGGCSPFVFSSYSRILKDGTGVGGLGGNGGDAATSTVASVGGSGGSDGSSYGAGGGGGGGGGANMYGTGADSPGGPGGKGAPGIVIISY